MSNLSNFYPFFWALCGVTAALLVVILEIFVTEKTIFVEKRRTRIRDKLHFSVVQNRGAA